MDAQAAVAAKEMPWEQLHSSPWHAVVPIWRDAYSVACLHVVKHHYSAGELKHALRALDMGLVVGGLTLRGDLNLCIGKVSASLRGTWVNEYLEGRQNGQWSKEFDLEKVRRVLPVKSLSCKEVEEKLGLSLDGFLREHLVPGSPVILCDSMTHCPAMNRWNDMNCLKQIPAGRKNYLNQEWKPELITFSEFLERIQSIDYAFANVTYLAQHQLFD